MYKLNIEGEPRSGFMTLTIYDNKNPNKVMCDWRGLRNFSDGQKIDLIVSYDIMRYLNIHQLGEVLKNWHHLLSENGIIRLSFIECNRFVFSVKKREMDLQMIHGLMINNNLYSIEDVKQKAKQGGFSINTINFDGIWSTIELARS